MGGDERSAIEVIAEFTSPFEDSLNVLILGDHIDELEAAEVKAAFDRTRNDFMTLPSVDEDKMAPIKYIKINTSEFFNTSNEELKNKFFFITFFNSISAPFS